MRSSRQRRDGSLFGIGAVNCEANWKMIGKVNAGLGDDPVRRRCAAWYIAGTGWGS